MNQGNLLSWCGYLSRVFCAATFCAAVISTGSAQDNPTSRSWNQPVKPFRVVGNIYYVGASEICSFLITTPEGHILLDSGFAETVPLIKSSISKLGFKLEDVKILVNSHAHMDHAGGLADLKVLTGAKLVASQADAGTLARGDRDDPQWGDSLAFRPVNVDRIIHDNEQISLGGVSMTARLTPGHTKGCTTWTMKVTEDGRQLDVLFLGSTTAPDYKLVDNPKYPNIVSDYEHTFALLKSLPCDVFLGAHGSFFGLLDKMNRVGSSPNPFIDPARYRDFIRESETDFRNQLRKQKA